MNFDENVEGLQRDVPWLHTGRDNALTPEKLEEFIELIVPKHELTQEWWTDSGRTGTIENIGRANVMRYAMHQLAKEIIKYLDGHRHEFSEWKEMRHYKGRENQTCACGQYRIRVKGDL